VSTTTRFSYVPGRSGRLGSLATTRLGARGMVPWREQIEALLH